jgi:hypothetical protein
MKNSSILSPDVGPFGLTRLEASVRAIVRAPFVKSPGGGAVDTVVTVRTHRRGARPLLLRVFARMGGIDRNAGARRRGR